LPIIGFIAQHVVVLMLVQWHWRIGQAASAEEIYEQV
jgi:hypothetical protein